MHPEERGLSHYEYAVVELEPHCNPHENLQIQEASGTAEDTLFFLMLDIPAPRDGGLPQDLERYFGARAYGAAVVNPYLHKSEKQERLLNINELPSTQFCNKVPSMCQQTWFLSPFIFFYNNHYELGSCLILEKPKLSSQVKATPKLQISKRFRHYRTTIQALVFSLIFICFAISLILYILTYDFAYGGFPYQDHCCVKVIQNSNATYEFQYQYKGAMSTSTDYKTAYYLVQSETGCTSYSSSSTPKFLATMFCLVGIFFLAVFTNTFKPATHRGLLRYLRQLGTPMVEEVMISCPMYWEALLKSGIGVWIDILKLTTGDKTSKTTRTVAAHARFVLIMLTTRYINSPACFVEIYEALRTPGASNRVIIYVVDETAYSTPDELCAVDLEKVKQLATQLESKGLKVLWKLTDLIDYLNKNVVYSVDRTHLLWWQRYVSAGAGVPDKAIPPDTKASNALKKCNLKLFTLPSFKSQGNRDCYGNEFPLRFTRHGISLVSRIRIANVWISGDLRELGQNASAFPWLFLIFSICLTLPVFDLLTGNLVTDARSSMFPLSIIFLAYSFGVVAGLLDLGDLLDRRLYMHSCLKPLLATNNFNRDKLAPYRWLGQKSPQWSRAEETTPLQQIRKWGFFHSNKKIEPTTSSSLKNCDDDHFFIAIHDFEMRHPVADNLRTFLGNIGFHQPNPERETKRASITVNVFVFGGGLTKHQNREEQESILQQQVQTFNQYLVNHELRVEECVLVCVNAEANTEDIPGLFGAKLSFPWQEDSVMGCYLMLLGSALGNSLGEEVLLQTGLRVKNALMRYAKMLK